MFIHVCCYGFSQGWKSLCNTVVCMINNISSSFFFLVPPVLTVPAVVEIFPAHEVIISVVGTPPVNTSIFKNLSDVVLTSNALQIRFFPGQEGNYTCVASNTYGSDERYFFVAFKGKTVPMISLTNHRFVSLRSKTSVYKYSCITVWPLQDYSLSFIQQS